MLQLSQTEGVRTRAGRPPQRPRARRLESTTRNTSPASLDFRAGKNQQAPIRCEIIRFPDARPRQTRGHVPDEAAEPRRAHHVNGRRDQKRVDEVLRRAEPHDAGRRQPAGGHLVAQRHRDHPASHRRGADRMGRGEGILRPGRRTGLERARGTGRPDHTVGWRARLRGRHRARVVHAERRVDSHRAARHQHLPPRERRVEKSSTITQICRRRCSASWSACRPRRRQARRASCPQAQTLANAAARSHRVGGRVPFRRRLAKVRRSGNACAGLTPAGTAPACCRPGL